MWVTYDSALPTGLWPDGDEPHSPSPDFIYYASTDPTPLEISESVYQQVFQRGEPQIQFVSAGGEPLAVLIAPLMGYGDRIIGILEITATPIEALQALQQNQTSTVILAIILSLSALILMGASTDFVVLRSLRHLTSVARRQLVCDLYA